MLLTQTAAGSEVEATVQDTVDTITGFNKFIQEKGPGPDCVWNPDSDGAAHIHHLP